MGKYQNTINIANKGQEVSLFPASNEQTRKYEKHKTQKTQMIHKRSTALEVQFVNKGIEFINLRSIFKDKSVISSIATYFEYKESPNICYKYNKPIRSTVLNYDKSVAELDIETTISDC